ncbi:MAG: S1 family peptidase [Sandaracinaceae bacterium]|nr:S1 family peptidase [Sandaracinaceae bacterium]
MRTRTLALALPLALGFGCAAVPGGGPGEPPDELLLGHEELIRGQEGSLQQAIQLTTCFTDGACGLCTGALIDPHTVLTAAHCVTSTSGAAVSSGSIHVPATGEDVAIVPALVLRHATYPTSGTAPGEVHDVALVGIDRAVSLTVDGPHYAEIGRARPADDSLFWLNGQKQDGVITDRVFHRLVRTVGPDEGDARYPFQLLDSLVETGEQTIEQGDSGGPLFRETAGEPNDGMGGTAPPSCTGSSRASGATRASTRCARGSSPLATRSRARRLARRRARRARRRATASTTTATARSTRAADRAPTSARSRRATPRRPAAPGTRARARAGRAGRRSRASVPRGRPRRLPPIRAAGAAYGDGHYCAASLGGEAGVLLLCVGGRTASPSPAPRAA